MNRRTRRVVGVAMGLAMLVAGAPARATDLLDAYRLARRADPVLAAAEAQRRVTDEGVAQARAPLLPQVAATYGLNQSHDGSEGEGRSRSRDVSANVSQVIVDLGLSAQVGVARAQSDAQAAALLAADQALCVRVATAYFGVLSASDALANVEAVEDAYLRQVEQSDQRYRNGLSAQADVEQARAYHANARARTIDARTTLADAREALAEITGTPTGTLKPLRAELPLAAPAPADPQAWVDRALAQNPALRAQQRIVDAADRTIGAARAGHAPTLTAGLGVGRTTLWPAGVGVVDPSNGRTATNVGLLLTVPLFSGGATESRVRQAYAQRDGARDQFETQRRRLARETLDRYRSVDAGIGQIRAGTDAVASARRALESMRVGLSLGTQTMTDLLLAIQTLSSSLDTLTQARERYVLGGLQLLQSAGAIGEADLAAVNALLE